MFFIYKGDVRMSWGYHLALDCTYCDKEAITSKETISAFVKELVEKIDMVAYGDPMIVSFGSGNKAGYTLVQLIETSNICGHFCDDSGDAYLDVFSCKEFDDNTVVEVVMKYFSPVLIKPHRLERQA